MATSRKRPIDRPPDISHTPPTWTPPTPTTKDPYRPVPRTTPKRSRTITLNGVEGNLDMPYGRQQLGGQIMFSYRKAAGDELWLVVVLGWGETDGEWGELLLNDKAVSAWGSTYAQYWFYRGAPGQTADPNLPLASWNEALAGVTYGVVRLRRFATYWQGATPAMKWRFRGRRCIDPRNPASPIAYSENLWVQDYDYRRDPSGQALPESALETADWADAADIADEVLGDGSKRYEYHPLVTDDASVEDWLAQFAIAGNGHPWWDGEKFRLFLDRPASPVATVTDSDLVRQGYRFDRRSDPFDKPNHVVIIFTDAADGYNVNAFEESKTAALIAGDEDPITVTHKLPGIHNRGFAKRLSIFLLNDLVFDGLLHRVERATAVDRKPGDVVTVVQAAKGLNQAFRAMPVKRNPDHTYDVEYLEYDAARYSDTTVADVSTIKSTFGNPQEQPPYPAGVAVDDKDAPEDVQTTTWEEIPIRSTDQYGAANWSTINCGNVTLANLNDGDYGTKALDFNVAGESAVIFDAGVGNSIEFRELVAAVTGPAVVTCAIEYSDDGSGYTQAGTIGFGTGASYLVDETGASFTPSRLVRGWASAGARRFWKLRQVGTDAKDLNINELQFHEFLGTYPWPDVVLLTAAGANPEGATVALAKPEAERVDTMSLGSFAYSGLNDSGYSRSSQSQLHVRSQAGLISWGVAHPMSVEVAAPNTTGYAPEFLAKGVTFPTLANGYNHDVEVSSIGTLIYCIGPTLAFGLTGLEAKDGGGNSGEAGRAYILFNPTTLPMTVVHESGSSTAANRFTCPSGIDVTVSPGGRCIVIYEETTSRWRVIPVPIVLHATDTWNPPSRSDGNDSSTTVTVTGAKVGDGVTVYTSGAAEGLGLIPYGRVSSDDTVTVYLGNPTGGTVDCGSVTVYVTVIKRC